VEGKTLLQHLVERTKKAEMVDEFIVATSTNERDQAIEDFCRASGIKCFRGEEVDVLDRYYQAIQHFRLNPDAVIRITADCPLHNAQTIDKVVGQYGSRGVDYFSNSNCPPDVLEDGIDTEVFRFSALEEAWREAKMASEREHVTLYIKNSGRFSCAFEKCHASYAYKLSVDTPEDLEAVSVIFAHFAPSNQFSIPDLLGFLVNHPEVPKINETSTINAGLAKSIENDRQVR
jgi:spore coat polysaccharide biosynthesis protein SpsF (cytidylyltransferase family)